MLASSAVSLERRPPSTSTPCFRHQPTPCDAFKAPRTRWRSTGPVPRNRAATASTRELPRTAGVQRVVIVATAPKHRYQIRFQRPPNHRATPAFDDLEAATRYCQDVILKKCPNEVVQLWDE